MRSLGCAGGRRRLLSSAGGLARDEILEPIRSGGSLARARALTYARRVAHAARNVPRSRALLLLAWLLCALLAPGTAFPALHFTLVSHRVCLEHGELEHVGSSVDGDADASAPDALDAPARTLADQAFVPGAAGDDDHGHEACGASASGTGVAVPRAERSGTAALHARPPSAPSDTERAHPGIALLRYAPKLAPPLRA